jgi:hypothetical protein
MPRSKCDQGDCGHEAEVYAIDPDPDGWGGKYCLECCRKLGFQIVDNLAQRMKRDNEAESN